MFITENLEIRLSCFVLNFADHQHAWVQENPQGSKGDNGIALSNISLSLSLSKLLNLYISVSLCFIAEKLDVKSIVNVLINHCFHCCTNFFSPFKSSKSVCYILTQLSVVLRFRLYCSESSMKFLASVWFQRKWKEKKSWWTKVIIASQIMSDVDVLGLNLFQRYLIYFPILKKLLDFASVACDGTIIYCKFGRSTLWSMHRFKKIGYCIVECFVLNFADHQHAWVQESKVAEIISIEVQIRTFVVTPWMKVEGSSYKLKQWW